MKYLYKIIGLFVVFNLFAEIKTTAVQSEVTKRLLVAGAFIIKDNAVLLAFRKSATDGGVYGLIGGKMEPGESIHAAVIREIYEEVGLIVKAEDLQLMHVLSFRRENGDEIISFDFIVKKWEGESINKEFSKHDHIQWFDLNNLPANIISRHKIAYDLFQRGIYYSTLGY